MSVMKKTYLQPKHLRRGTPTITFVTAELVGSSTVLSYWLGTYSVLKAEIPSGSRAIQVGGRSVYRGEARDYEITSKVRITKDLYDAFIEESCAQHLKYGRMFPDE